MCGRTSLWWVELVLVTPSVLWGTHPGQCSDLNGALLLNNAGRVTLVTCADTEVSGSPVNALWQVREDEDVCLFVSPWRSCCVDGKQGELTLFVGTKYFTWLEMKVCEKLLGKTFTAASVPGPVGNLLKGLCVMYSKVTKAQLSHH